MIERGICPNSSVVAEFAGRRESGRRVRRIGCTRVIFLMARIARRAVERIVAVDVAIGAQARRNRMRASQREACGRVVKRGVGPETGVVTAFASGRECGCDVIHRRLRIIVIRLMARDAGGGGQVVIVVDVTIRTCPRRNGVTAREREPGGAVIERGVEPGTRGVALVASLREIRRDVIRVGRSLVVLQVATHAGRCIEVVVVVDVAIGAGPRRNGVQSGERETGAVVIEGGIEP